MKLNPKSFLFCCLVFQLSISGLFAQEHAVKTFSIDDGLPSNNVYEVKQDNQGFYWVCTDNGVVIYDGYKFRPLPGKDNPFNRDTWWTMQDNQDRIWGLGLSEKPWIFDKDTFIQANFNIDKTPLASYYSTARQDQHNTYWLVTGATLVRYLNDKLETFDYASVFGKPGLPPVWPIIQQNKEREITIVTSTPLSVWKTTESGQFKRIYQYQDTVFRAISSERVKLKPPKDFDTAHCFSDTSVSLVVHNKDTISLIWKKQVKQFINGQVQPSLPLPESEVFNYSNYDISRIGNLFLFKNARENFVTDAQFNHLPKYDFLRNYQINTAYLDHEQNLWISTRGKGLVMMTKDALSAELVSILPDKYLEITDIEKASDGTIWIAHNFGVAYGNKTDGWKNLNIENLITKGETMSSIRNIRIYKHFLVVLTGHFGVRVIDIKNPNKPIVKQFLRTKFLAKTVNRLADGTIYLADSKGSSRFTLSNSDELDLIEEFQGFSIAYTQSDGGIQFIAGPNGVSILGPEKHKSRELSLRVKDFYQAPTGQTFAIHAGRGASALVDTTFQSIEDLEELLVHNLLLENDSTLWASTNRGLIKLLYSENSFTYHIDKKFTTVHGLPTNDVIDFELDVSYFYIGTSKGLTVIDRKEELQQEGHTVLLTKISSNGFEFGQKENYYLAPNQNSLDLEYVYISPKSNGQITYEYKLEGIDDDWKQTTETRLSYPFLPSAHYRFNLRAIDINGVRSNQNLDLQITVQQYWYKTTWFIVLSFLVSILLIGLGFYIRFRQIKKREEEQTEINNKMAELRLNALQSQMNPHFVFNVLNSIQESFLTKNVLEANRYMTDFSRLMRLFLDSSTDKLITIEKEIELITYYIELERMRLDKKFEFDIKVDSNLDTEDFKLPTMLLQPIIENAILHGLRHSERDGALTIDFTLENDYTIVVNVIDNGVGRKRSNAINAASRKSHTSKASGIIDERIAVINKTKENTVEMKYFDLEFSDGEAGTRVELKITLQENKG